MDTSLVRSLWHTDTHTDTDTHRQTQTHTQTDTDAHTDRHRRTHRQTQTHTQTDTDAHTDRLESKRPRINEGKRSSRLRNCSHATSEVWEKEALRRP